MNVKSFWMLLCQATYPSIHELMLGKCEEYDIQAN